MKKISNPPNPFQSEVRELLEPAPEAKMSVYIDSAKSILTPNDSPDLSLKWSLNPYRGCFHACAYCYARQYHEYLDWSAGTDFETKIAIKKNAPRLLKEAFDRKSWKGETILFSGATDCYQPLEATYKLTRQCLETCLEYQNPVAIITKSFLCSRDADLLQDLHKKAYAPVILSVPFASDEMARKIEPQASTIERRFQAMEILAKRGIPIGLSLAPTIPGLNEKDIPLVMKRAADAGATFVFHTLVRLAGSVEKVFRERLEKNLAPERAERVEKRIRETRGGSMTDNRFGHRMKGKGTYWDSIHDLFNLSKRKFNLDRFPKEPTPSPFKRPTPQLEMDFSPLTSNPNSR